MPWDQFKIRNFSYASLSMTRVGRDFSNTTQRDAVSPVSADVLFASSRFPNYKNRTNNNTLEALEDADLGRVGRTTVEWVDC
ncbi:hypothetical protein L2E82_35746 [Cichorium intybus]|uniref:Uncharacterized protein n=1 Tax=Cichorium intybus TaxID=13427 RepID=A0ACB9BPR4_CICIN|nr:hypothetical protein L2E82_35746 [Cichorium intybus]